MKKLSSFFLGCPIVEDLQTSGVYVIPLLKTSTDSIPLPTAIQCLPRLVRARISGRLYVPFHFFLLSGTD
jgi:hypothetical protein